MYIIARTNGHCVELFADMNLKDGFGEWRESGIGLPLTFDKRSRALDEMYKQMDLDPEWDYEVRDYLR